MELSHQVGHTSAEPTLLIREWEFTEIQAKAILEMQLQRLTSLERQKIEDELKELREHLTKNADDVGPKFPEEARKMHYGEIEHRSIYGEASPQEAKDLLEEGIELHPLPVLPDERN